MRTIVKVRLWVVVSAVLLAAALRSPLLTAYPFHADEALFAALARHIVQNGDLLLAHTGLLVDKPPLFFYVLALGKSMDWASELTGRLPGYWAGLLSVVLAARLAATLFDTQRATVAAAFAFALNPFLISFAPTAFADPQLIMWWLAALLAVSLRRWGWAGLLTGLAFATKQNALFLLPAVVLLAFYRRVALRDALRSLAGLLPVLLLMVVWNSARPGDFWAAGVGANNPGRLVYANELLPRLQSCAHYFRVASGGVLGIAALCGGVGAALPHASRTDKRLLSGMGLFALAYFAFHLLVALPTLDRYALPLAVTLMLALVWAADKLPGWGALVLVVALVPAALLTVQGHYAIGSDWGARDGIHEVVDVMAAQPPGTILYYHGVGWELSYYLFDAPIVLASAASPPQLTTDLTTFGPQPAERYLLLPGWLPHAETLHAITEAGWRAVPILTTTNRFGEVSFVLYHLEQ